jgi:hypothetical protein
MKYLNLTKHILTLLVFALVFSACEKAKTDEPLGTAGTTIVKLIKGGSPATIAKRPVAFANTPSTFVAVDLRRDIPNETELNKTMKIVIKDDTAAVNFFNADTVSTNPNATNPGQQFYVKLPTAYYTIGASTPKTGGQGGVFNITLNPGDFSKEILITIPDATVLDPSTLYALGFTIQSVDAGGKISESKSVLVEVGAKNILHEDLKWDFFRWNLAAASVGIPTAPRSSGWDNDPITLTTIAGNANEIPSGYFTQPRYRLTFTDNGGTATNFVLTVNPADEAGLAAAGITYVNRPVILQADFAAKKYKFAYQVFNGTAFRYIVDYYHP